MSEDKIRKLNAIIDQGSDLVVELSDKFSFMGGKLKSQSQNSEQVNETFLNLRDSYKSLGSEITKNLRIVATLAELEDFLHELEGILDNIDEKAKAIQEIAFQAKMLSFNASIEAARAQEHGRGFAVVAEEMSKLATRSDLASREISGFLGEHSAKLRENTEKLSGEVSRHQKQSQMLAESLHSTQGEMERITKTIGEITQDNRQISKDVEDISQNTRTQLEFLLGILSESVAALAGIEINTIPATEVYERRSSFVIVDVRRPEEFNDDLGHIQGAVLSTLQTTLKKDLDRFDIDKPTVFVCRSGGRSTKAAQMALRRGFKRVYNLEGGMLKWREVGLPAEGTQLRALG